MPVREAALALPLPSCPDPMSPTASPGGPVPLPSAQIAAARATARAGPAAATPRTSRPGKPGKAGTPAASSRADRVAGKAAPRTVPVPSPPPTSTAGYAAPAGSGEWAFLDSKTMSIEEKLFLFMEKVMEKTDKELQDKMKAYKAQFTKSSSSSGSGLSLGSLFDVAKALLPPLGLAADFFGEAGLKHAAGVLGGGLLSALATAVGAPALVPVAAKLGSDLGSALFADAVKSGAASGGTTAAAGSPDEKMMMLELQMLVEKQQRMFAAISGAMKAMHDAGMVAAQNIR